MSLGAAHRVRKRGLTAAWRRGPKAEKALVVRQLRHRIGVAVVRAQQQQLASRISMVRQGPGVLTGKVHREEPARATYGDMAWAAANSVASAKAASRRGLLEVD